MAMFRQRVDEEVDRTAGADTERHAVLDIRERGQRGAFLAGILVHLGPPEHGITRDSV